MKSIISYNKAFGTVKSLTNVSQSFLVNFTISYD